VKAWVEGTPRELEASRVATPEVRDSGTEKRLEVEEEMASVIWTNDEGAGSLATDHPLFWRRALKGKETPEERRASAKVDGRRETRRTL